MFWLQLKHIPDKIISSCLSPLAISKQPLVLPLLSFCIDSAFLLKLIRYDISQPLFQLAREMVQNQQLATACLPHSFLTEFVFPLRERLELTY